MFGIEKQIIKNMKYDVIEVEFKYLFVFNRYEDKILNIIFDIQ